MENTYEQLSKKREQLDNIARKLEKLGLSNIALQVRDESDKVSEEISKLLLEYLLNDWSKRRKPSSGSDLPLLMR